ncbi:2852_t:CDS:2 [Diversispora eburnea]|uniref:2852_t:CDS:1 n=1 Tax=Diversispora eburnea TaxID=1213867 RepID=A0A9N8ZV94_9GLOM|nr:2852_t:CDS:2 [Diversispora eburnea]
MSEGDDNKTIQQEEILALTSIFGSDIFQLDPQDSLNQSYLFKLSLESDISSTTSSEYRSHSKNFITIKFQFPNEYPSTSPPNYKITSLYCGTLKIDKIIKNEVDKKFKELFIPGQRSVFVAHLAPVNNISEVNLVRETLMLNKKVAKATHNIMAYRIIRDDGILIQETAAGGRLLHLLQLVNAKNIIVIVSRWYGGIQLGADRFKDINNVARDLLEKCGYVNGGNGSVGKNGNKSGGGDNKKTKKK